MWQPPTIECRQALGAEAIAATVSPRPRSIEFVDDFTHVTTHRNVIFHVYRGVTSARRGEWIEIDTLPDRSLSNAHRRVLATADILPP